MRKPKVFVTRLIPAAGLEQVREYCDADIWTEPLPPPADVLRRKVSDCEGLLSLLTERIDGALLDAAPRLRVVSNYAVGFNNIDVPAATERGVAVGNTPGVLTDATADMAFCLLIGAARRLVEGHQYSQSGKWKTWEPLGHLGQDLTDRQPPATDDPLLKLPNLSVAPHIASATVRTRNAMAEICADNLIAGLAGQKLPAWVNPEVEGKRRKV